MLYNRCVASGFSPYVYSFFPLGYKRLSSSRIDVYISTYHLFCLTCEHPKRKQGRYRVYMLGRQRHLVKLHIYTWRLWGYHSGQPADALSFSDGQSVQSLSCHCLRWVTYQFLIFLCNCFKENTDFWRFYVCSNLLKVTITFVLILFNLFH